MLLIQLLTTVGEIFCSRVLMPDIFLGRTTSMLMFPQYGSWFGDKVTHVNGTLLVGLIGTPQLI